jgi:heme-degrading monooxygenase HmoA
VYGTVMIGRLAPTATAQAVVQTLEAWSARERADGFVDAHVLVTDDRQQIVIATRFASKEQYWALADNPGQDEWYRTTLAPLLDGDPTWIDGTWST